MSFQGLSEDGTKYSSLLTAKRQEKPNILACNVIILSNMMSFPKRASVAWTSFMVIATSAFPLSLIINSNYNYGNHSLQNSHPLALALWPAVGKLLHWPVLTNT